jgi:hypothetical protein
VLAYENPAPDSGFVSSPTVVTEGDSDSVGSRVTQGILGHTDSFPDSTGVEGTLTDATRALDTAALDPGTYYYEVATDDDSETLRIQVGSDGTTLASAP